MVVDDESDNNLHESAGRSASITSENDEEDDRESTSGSRSRSRSLGFPRFPQRRQMSSVAPNSSSAAMAVGETTERKFMDEGDLSASGSEADEKENVVEGKPDTLDELQGLSESTKARLRDKGITSLFEVQLAAFDPGMKGRDLIVRSRTGTGKTIAFGLPMIERLKQLKARGAPGSPAALIMAPTRELARQVENEISSLDPHLTSVCVYGGSAYGPMLGAIERGVDLVIGTPGRMNDLLERGALKLDRIKVIVLDEADEMLRVGFKEQMDTIIKMLPKERQTFLFSATMPDWVSQISRSYMNDPLILDLVKSQKIKTSDTVNHIAILASPFAKEQILGDVLAIYGGMRAIVFVPTKKQCDELARSPFIRDNAGVLHGDINQAAREIALAGFRSGKYPVLVATDVAARGIDIPDVDVVIQWSLPDSRSGVEAYIHRSGRTGRAGKLGTAIIFYSEREVRELTQLEKEIGARFERRSPPHMSEVFAASSEKASKELESIPESVVNHFQDAATRFIEKHGMQQDPAALKRFVAAALASVSGHDEEVTERSVLSHKENFTAVEISSPGRYLERRDITNFILRSLAHLDRVPQIGKTVTYEGGAVVDIASDAAKELLAKGLKGARDMSVKVVAKLPEQVLESMAEGGFGGLGGRQSQGFGGKSQYGGGRSSGGYGGARGGDRSSRGGFAGKTRSFGDRGDSDRSRGPRRDPFDRTALGNDYDDGDDDWQSGRSGSRSGGSKSYEKRGGRGRF